MPFALLAGIELSLPADFLVALGAVESSSSATHINIGSTQIHTVGAEWPGWLECWSVEPLPIIMERLQQIHGNSCSLESALLICGCRGITRVHVQAAPEGITCDTEGSHPGGSGTLITLTRAVMLVPPACLALLHDFFTSKLLLGPGEVELSPAYSDGSFKSHSCCTVRFNSGQLLVFVEADDPNLLLQPSSAEPLTITVYADSVAGFRESWEASQHVGCGGSKSAANGGDRDGAWEATSAAAAFRVRTPIAILDLEVRSLAHVACPLPRRDLVAAGVPVPTAEAFKNWPPLPPLPFEQRGIPRMAGGSFGDSAREIAARRNARRAGSGWGDS